MWLLISLLSLSYCAVLNAQEPATAFERLIRIGSQSPSESSSVLEKDFLALDAYASGDLDRAVRIWGELVKERAGTDYSIEPLLCLLKIAERYTGSAETVRSLAQDETLSVSPTNARMFRQALLDAATSITDATLARQSAQALGVITEWDRVVGPFGHSGPMDFEERFSVERDPWALSYIGWLGDVTPQAATTSADGFLDFGSVLWGESGVGYALVCLKADREGDTVLEIHSSAAVSCWWNGFRVMSSNPYDLDLRTRIRISVPVRPGHNWLLVKCLSRSSGWSFRCALEGFGTWITKGELTRDTRVHPDYQTFLEPRLESPWMTENSLAQTLLPGDPSESLRWLTSIYRAVVAWHAGEFKIARRILDGMRESQPTCTLIHRLAGDLLLSWAQQQTVSKTRLENEAADCYRKALDTDPGNVMASVGLALFHLLRNTPDEALRLLEAVRKEYQDAHPDLPLPVALSYALNSAYKSKGFTLKQERSLLQTAEGSGLASRLALVDLIDLWISQRAHSRAFEFAKTKLERGISLRDGSAYTALLRAFPKESPERERILRTVLDFRPSDRSLFMNLGDSLASRKDWEDALKAYHYAAQLCPPDPKPWEAMASLHQVRLASGETVTEASTEVVRCLTESLKRDQNPQIRDRLFCFQTAKGHQPQKPFHLLQRYDVSLDDVLKEQIPWHKYGLGSSALIVDTAVARLHRNGTREMLTHQSARILNQQGIDAWAELTLPADESSTWVLAAHTRTEDGLQMLPGNVTRGTGARAVSLSGVQVGSVVDFCYVETVSSPGTPGANFWTEEFFFGQKEDATYLCRFVVLVPEGMTLHWVSQPETFAPRVEAVPATLTDGEGALVAYIWERKDIPGIRDEGNSPPLSQLVHSVKVSTCPDHRVAMRRAESLFLGRDESDDVFQILTAKLASPEMSDREKTDAVYQWIQDNIQSGGSANRTVLDVLHLGEGSSLERALLARTLLDHLNIDSRIQFSFELGSESQTPPIPLGDRYGSPLLFVEDATGESRLLDLSSQYLSPGEITASFLNGLLLNVDSLGYSVEPAATQQVNAGWIARDLKFKFLNLDSTEVGGELVYEGLYRPLMRQMLEDRRVAERVLDQQVAKQLHGLVTEHSMPVLESNQAPRLQFKGRMPHMLIPSGSSEDNSGAFEFVPITDPADLSSLVPDATREHPMVFTQWVVIQPYQATFAFEGERGGSSLDGFVFRHIPDDQVLMTEFGIHVITYRLRGDVLRVRRSLIVPQQRISVDKYPRFARFCRLVDETEKRKIVVERF